MFYCDRTKAGNGCYEFGDLIDVPLGTDDDTSTGWLSEDIVLSLMWDMRDSEDDFCD